MPEPQSDPSAMTTAQGMVAWIQNQLPDLDVAVRGSADVAPRTGVDLRLLALTPRPGPRTPPRADVLAVDYLITVRLDDGLAEHAAAAELAFSAMDRSDLEMLTGGSVAESCAALGLTRAPGLIVRAHIARGRPDEPHPRVRQPLEIGFAPIGEFPGQVVGPGGVPVAGALVTLAGLDRAARSGPDGRFRLRGPSGSSPLRMTARAKGVEASAEALSGRPTTLHLPLET